MAATTSRKIRKNSRERSEMWDHATRAISYTLNNCFVGEDVAVEGARDWFEKISARSHRTIDVTYNGRAYVIHYHSNHWTELLVPPATLDDVEVMREP